MYLSCLVILIIFFFCLQPPDSERPNRENDRPNSETENVPEPPSTPPMRTPPRPVSPSPDPRVVIPSSPPREVTHLQPTVPQSPDTYSTKTHHRSHPCPCPQTETSCKCWLFWWSPHPCCRGITCHCFCRWGFSNCRGLACSRVPPFTCGSFTKY